MSDYIYSIKCCGNYLLIFENSFKWNSENIALVHTFPLVHTFEGQMLNEKGCWKASVVYEIARPRFWNDSA